MYCGIGSWRLLPRPPGIQYCITAGGRARKPCPSKTGSIPSCGTCRGIVLFAGVPPARPEATFWQHQSLGRAASAPGGD
eukprot:3276391-Alexandrium_andersonii.AAC.1